MNTRQTALIELSLDLALEELAQHYPGSRETPDWFVAAAAITSLKQTEESLNANEVCLLREKIERIKHPRPKPSNGWIYIHDELLDTISCQYRVEPYVLKKIIEDVAERNNLDLFTVETS